MTAIGRLEAPSDTPAAIDGFRIDREILNSRFVRGGSLVVC